MNCTSVVCSYAKPELLGGMSNRFALHTATLRNAQLAGIGEVTGDVYKRQPQSIKAAE